MSDVFPDPDGILPVDKPAGMPSHVIVTTLRRKFGFAKVGHGGTLDPDATGLLLILLGKGTKISDRVMGGDKTYRGTIRFGVATTTQDRLGDVLEERPTEGLTQASVEAAIARDFLGDLFPYFSSDIVFDQSNVRKALGDKILDWEYGQKGLEILIRSFYKDYFPNVEWLQTLANAPLDREPHC